MFAVSWIYWPVNAPPLQIGRDTTYLSGPINPDGTVNYVAAINEIASKGVTPENNAAIPVLLALGPEMIDVKVRKTVLAQLRMEHLPAPGQHFTKLNDFIRTNRQDLLVHEKSGKVVVPDRKMALIVWRVLNGEAARLAAEDRALVDAWLAANHQPLELLAQATQKPRFYVPMADSNDPPRMATSHCANVYLCLDASNALAMRAELRLADGDVEAACQDAQALHRLAGLYCQQVGTIPFAVGIRTDTLACQIDSHIAGRSNLSADQARRMLADLKGLPVLPTIEQAINRGDRCFHLDAVMHLMCSPATFSNGKTMPLHHTGAIDFNWILRRINTEIDDDMVPLRVADYAKRERLFAEHRDRVKRDIEWSAGHGSLGTACRTACYWLSPPSVRVRLQSEQLYQRLHVFLVPSLAASDDSRLTAAMHRQLNQVAFALSAWHAERGSYPDTLVELVPDYLAQVPPDLFANRPLIYLPGDSGYLLYSVGQNGKDDAGSPVDDIVVQTPARPAPATSVSERQTP